MNGTSHDDRSTDEPELTDLIEMGAFEHAAQRLQLNDEISRNILDNDDALSLAMPLARRGMTLERVGLAWFVTPLISVASDKAVA